MSFPKEEPENLSSLLEQLERLAREATPGPWYVEGSEIRHDFDPFATDEGIPDCSVLVCEVFRISKDLDSGERDREFIAQANPDTVLRLIEYVRSLERENEIVRQGAYGEWEVYRFNFEGRKYLDRVVLGFPREIFDDPDFNGQLVARKRTL